MMTRTSGRRSARRGGGRTFWSALGAALLLTVLAGVFMVLIARAPDGHVGRILVFFDAPLSDQEAYLRLAAAGAEPIRVMSAADGWIAEARVAGAVGRLRRVHGASWIFRDMGLGRALAGCLAFARPPAGPRRTVP